MFKRKIIAATLAVSALALVAACAQTGGGAGATGQENATQVEKGMGSPDLERNQKDKLVAPTNPNRQSQDALIREGQTGNK